MRTVLKPLLFFTLLAALAACGRAGPLEPPPASAAQTAGPETGETETEDRRFILDGLLN